MLIPESFHACGRVIAGKPIVVSCLLLLAFVLAACNMPGISDASGAPSQAVDSSASPLQLNSTISSNRLPIEKPDETALPVGADLPDLGAAPELTNEIWLNSDQALRLADLGGKVILLDMWTFG